MGAASRHFSVVEADPNADGITRDMNRAIEAAAHGDWDQAILALERVMQVDPDNPLVCWFPQCGYWLTLTQCAGS